MLLPVLAFAVEEAAHAPYTGSAEFERLKTLAGAWKGTSISHGKEGPAEALYEISSGRSALVEKLFAGTEHEMVSVYNDEKGAPVMTHYCMLKNQPKLKLTASTESQLNFEWTEANGVELTEPHMHSLKITFNGPDEITQEWSYFEGGKESGPNTLIRLKRQV